MLRHCPSRRQSLENLNKIQPCLGEISFDIALDATLFAQGPLSVDVSKMDLQTIFSCYEHFLLLFRNSLWQ